MLKVEEARKIILENTGRMESETVDILSALNRILSEDIYSPEDIPQFNNSAMDGYAVISSILKGSSETEPSVLEVRDNVPAGHSSEYVVQGNTAVKIMTGAPVPEGADAVIPIEFTKAEGSTVKIFREAAQWENIRFSGEDVRKGQLVISNGKKLRPAEIGMLAALNISRVKVSKQPVISILATGDELVNPGEEKGPGKIRNINGHSLYSLALQHGCIPINLGIAKDNRREIGEILKMSKNSDILIVSGGVSVGDYDYAKSVLTEMGMLEKFWKVAVKPGKPVLFGTIGKMLVFGLPGNPVSSMVSFEEFVLPAIYKLQGRNQKPWHEINTILDGTIIKAVGLTHFIRGKTSVRDGKIFVTPTGSQSSGVLSSMVNADCLIVVPSEVTDIQTGEEVLIQITDGIGD